jgi:glycosyltransferase involved in cell wall biosynthesis
MKKILYIYGNLPAYRKDFFTDLNGNLLSKNIQMKVIYGEIMNKVVRQDDDSNYIKIKLPTQILNLKYLRITRMVGLLKQVKKESPQAIIFQFNQTNISQWFVLFYCILKKTPYAIWGCNYTRHDLKKPLVYIRNKIYNFIYKNSSLIIPYGTIYRNYLINTGISEKKIIVAQNTINIEKIIESSNSDNRKFDSTTHVLYVGAIAPQKKIETSINAVAKLIEHGYRIVFNIIGGGFISQLEKHLEKYSDNIKKSIIIHGPKYGDDVKTFFENSDVFLMPGTGGLGVNEAMAYGLPIISTLGDETIFDLIDGNGYLLKEMGNIEEQVISLKKFIASTREQKAQMSKRSLNIIRERASLKNMVEKHVKACQLLIEKKNEND